MLRLQLLCVSPTGGPDWHQMALLRVAGTHLVAHRLPRDGGGPHPGQLWPLPALRRAERVEEEPEAGPARALALLVGRRPQLRRAHPPRALQ